MTPMKSVLVVTAVLHGALLGSTTIADAASARGTDRFGPLVPSSRRAFLAKQPPRRGSTVRESIIISDRFRGGGGYGNYGDDPYYYDDADNRNNNNNNNNNGYYYDEDERGDDYYPPSNRREGPSSRSGGNGGSRTAALTQMLKNGNRKVGFPVLGAGAVLTILGASLFFNKALMRLGNLCFVAGVPLTIGPARAAGYFLKREKARATGCLAVGIFLVLVGWPVLGIALEVFGLLNLFGNMFPIAMAVLKTMPVIGPLLRGKSSSGNKGRRSGGGRGYDDGRDRYYDDDDRSYGDSRYDDRDPYYRDGRDDDNRGYY